MQRKIQWTVGPQYSGAILCSIELRELYIQKKYHGCFPPLGDHVVANVLQIVSLFYSSERIHTVCTVRQHTPASLML